MPARAINDSSDVVSNSAVNMNTPLVPDEHFHVTAT